MASVHPGGEGGRRRRGSSLGSSSSGIGNSNRRNRDDGLEMEPHFRIVSGVHSSPGGKRFQEDMAVKNDDFKIIKREIEDKGSRKFLRRGFCSFLDIQFFPFNIILFVLFQSPKLLATFKPAPEKPYIFLKILSLSLNIFIFSY